MYTYISYPQTVHSFLIRYAVITRARLSVLTNICMFYKVSRSSRGSFPILSMGVMDYFPGPRTLWCSVHHLPLNITHDDNNCVCTSTDPYAFIAFTWTKLSLCICSRFYVSPSRLIICSQLIPIFLKIFRPRKELI